MNAEDGVPSKGVGVISEHQSLGLLTSHKQFVLLITTGSWYHSSTRPEQNRGQHEGLDRPMLSLSLLWLLEILF